MTQSGQRQIPHRLDREKGPSGDAELGPVFQEVLISDAGGRRLAHVNRAERSRIIYIVVKAFVARGDHSGFFGNLQQKNLVFVRLESEDSADPGFDEEQLPPHCDNRKVRIHARGMTELQPVEVVAAYDAISRAGPCITSLVEILAGQDSADGDVRARPLD